MLSIALIGSHQEKYYTSLAAEDYYTEGGEPPGTWHGQAATALGLTGSVSKEDLSLLLKGFAPDGRRLARNAGSATRRAGFDLTFSADKTVSVLGFALGDDSTMQAVRAAHAQAVAKALDYIEDSAVRVRRGFNGQTIERARMVAATYEHSTARLVQGESVPDPHLHTHCVVINAGLTEDGQGGTLDSRELFRHKMAAGAVYRAELFKELEIRLGERAERRGKQCALKSVPRALVKHFSKRRRAIEDDLKARGLEGTAEEAESAAKRTRTTKPEVDREGFIQHWRRVARELLGKLQHARRDASEEPSVHLKVVVDMRAEARAAATRITDRQSHFAERDLVRAVAEAVEDKAVGADRVIGACREYLQSDLVFAGSVTGEKRYTTQEMLALEKRMLDRAATLSRTVHRVSFNIAQGVLKSRETITEEQARAFQQLTQGKALSIVRGVAGTGKTYLMDAAREAWERQGYQVVGCSLAAAAAKRLEEGSRINSSSIHALLYRIKNGEFTLTEKTVLVVDEAGMVGTRMMEELVTLVQGASAKLVLVGDDRQLQAINAGAPFASMGKAFGTSELVEIRRQRDGWAKDAVVEFSTGEARMAMKRFIKRDLLFVAGTRLEAFTRIVSDWRESAREVGMSEALILTGTRSEAARINREVQLRRRAEGELGARIQMGEQDFFVGDRIVFRRNSKRRGLVNGDRGEVVAATKDTMTVRLDDGQRVTIHVGDSELVSPQLGYASTTHSAQGATVERCFVLVGGSMQDREATYVQASRARGVTRLYTDATSAGDELSDLLRGMERSRAKDLATDLMGEDDTGPTVARAS